MSWVSCSYPKGHPKPMVLPFSRSAGTSTPRMIRHDVAAALDAIKEGQLQEKNLEAKAMEYSEKDSDDEGEDDEDGEEGEDADNSVSEDESEVSLYEEGDKSDEELDSDDSDGEYLARGEDKAVVKKREDKKDKDKKITRPVPIARKLDGGQAVPPKNSVPSSPPPSKSPQTRHQQKRTLPTPVAGPNKA
ncbi:hypothetical protein K488DRAFT_68989 [Vararia minispora EC-137]|uniref:Uncharacterized protein n=1 Tax=Vararia minispora EC-137 TaxID=1314806 RepID=A0ACB8QSM5_9AGAM|nr:hypothetical protein K488DRAFT_68989 [Vararia minispora EC-137]